MSTCPEIDQSVLEGISCPNSGDYYLESHLMWICVAVEKDGPKIIGSYTDFAILSSSNLKNAQKEISKMIWKTYMRGKGLWGGVTVEKIVKEDQ